MLFQILNLHRYAAGCVAQSIKDGVTRDETEQMVRSRGGLMALAGGGRVA